MLSRPALFSIFYSVTHLNQKAVLDLFESDVQTRFNLRLSDIGVPTLIEDPCLEACFIYRLAHSIYMEDPLNKHLPLLADLMHRSTGMQIYYSNQIGRGLNVQHGLGSVIGPRNVIGSSFTFHQGVTVGQRHLNSPREHATIGDNVTLFAGAKVLGRLTIGNGVSIGANAVLLSDAKEGTWTGIPAKQTKKREHADPSS